MKRVYIDGDVDIANRAILYESGVRQVNFPRLAILAEKVGYFSLTASVRLGQAFYGFRDTSEARPSQKTSRAWGTGIIVAGLSVGLIAQYDDIIAHTMQASEAVGEAIDVESRIPRPEGW